VPGLRPPTLTQSTATTATTATAAACLPVHFAGNQETKRDKHHHLSHDALGIQHAKLSPAPAAPALENTPKYPNHAKHPDCTDNDTTARAVGVASGNDPVPLPAPHHPHNFAREVRMAIVENADATRDRTRRPLQKSEPAKDATRSAVPLAQESWLGTPPTLQVRGNLRARAGWDWLVLVSMCSGAARYGEIGGDGGLFECEGAIRVAGGRGRRRGREGSFMNMRVIERF
jgi:hypothetical protein